MDHLCKITSSERHLFPFWEKGGNSDINKPIPVRLGNKIKFVLYSNIQDSFLSVKSKICYGLLMPASPS